MFQDFLSPTLKVVRQKAKQMNDPLHKNQDSSNKNLVMGISHVSHSISHTEET